MKKTQFTEQQIVAMLKQHEQGLRAVDIARANGISEKTLYRWKSKYGGMDIKELKRVKELLEAGAEVNSSILTLAIYVKSITIVKLLLPYCEDVNQLPVRLDDTPLMSAAWKGLDTVIKLLIEKGASVNYKNRHG
ncbi:MAG: hypothetical protein KFKLKKLM_00001 [Flavobacteriales bacterium]|nr:hypothetical protein [Flavobacteriales bacterium]